MNPICRAFGHHWDVADFADNNNALPELEPKWKKTCSRCGYYVKTYSVAGSA